MRCESVNHQKRGRMNHRLRLSRAPSLALGVGGPQREGNARDGEPSQRGIGVDGNGVDVDGPVVGPGKPPTATANLKPGTYESYCTVKSHQQAGMTGTLVVK